jgi:hypothetical protein
MEDLREKVYECTLAVEAHMICDLLARAGISARVDGEFLAGAGGDLPLGSAIKVRVDPARAAEAREVINEWEREQPPSDPGAPPPPRSRVRSPLWFLAGILAGGAVMFLALKTPNTEAHTDSNGDGIDDEFYYYSGNTLSRFEADRNGDRKIDARSIFDLHALLLRYEGDDDFDGRFEVQSKAEEGEVVTSTLDSNGDGRPDAVTHYHLGIAQGQDVYDEQGRRIVARMRFDGPLHSATDFDDDGDGVFERHVEYDRYGEPKTR